MKSVHYSYRQNIMSECFSVLVEEFIAPSRRTFLWEKLLSYSSFIRIVEAFKMKRPVRIGILPLESMKQEVLTAMFLHKSLKDSGSFPLYHENKKVTLDTLISSMVWVRGALLLAASLLSCSTICLCC